MKIPCKKYNLENVVNQTYNIAHGIYKIKEET